LFLLINYVTANCPQKPGGATVNGTVLPYDIACNNYIGGVCDTCPSLYQVLSGCSDYFIFSNSASFSPAIPSILYIGESYYFTVTTCASDLNANDNINIRLPPGMTFSLLSSSTGTLNSYTYSFTGTPTVTSPFNTYIVAYVTLGACNFRTEFSFSVQNQCTPTPTSSSSTGSLECSDANEGYLRCSGSGYQTCDHGSWTVAQPCAPGTSCQQDGDYIYCD